MKLRYLLIVFSFAVTFCGMTKATEEPVPYPDNYRNWAHIKTMLITPGHPLENPFLGIHHVYANEKARQGLETGRYPDSSIIVFDLLKSVTKDQTIQEGERKLVGIMHKDMEKYRQTGGWGFEAFAGDSKTERLVKDKGVSCFACHTSQKSSDYVFSRLRD